MLFTRQTGTSPEKKSCLVAYIDLWKEADTHLPKDVAILPCDKAALKRALVDEMAGRAPDVIKFMGSMYRRLALFQKFTPADRKALASAYAYIGVLAAKSGMFGEAERAKVSMMLFADEGCNRLMDKVIHEDRQLQDELIKLGYVSFADRQSEWQEIANLANAQSAKLGMSTVITTADVAASPMAQGVR